jgi:hypothetical protein
MKRIKGFYYDKLHGWIGDKLPQNRQNIPTWVVTDDGRRCITKNHVLIKWSLIGTQILLWHPQEITNEDFKSYNPPIAPKGLKLVRE